MKPALAKAIIKDIPERCGVFYPPAASLTIGKKVITNNNGYDKPSNIFQIMTPIKPLSGLRQLAQPRNITGKLAGCELLRRVCPV